jgi:methylated-DNA-[protein]-cysteine S-methyltransferase
MPTATVAAGREARIAGEPSHRTSLGLAVFPSALGWMAVVGKEDTLIRLTFGHGSYDDAMAALRDDHPWWQAAGAAITSMDWNPRLVRRLQAYADGAADNFLDVPIDLSDLSDFQRRVVKHCRRIPVGRTRTYGQLAALAGSPGAARAVGNVMSANCTPLVMPCHRVVASGGKIGHYSAGGGRRMKLRLLESEAATSASRRRLRARPR